MVQPLMVTPWEAALGTSVEVDTPGGSVIEVTVPAGWKAGRKLRLKGRGIPEWLQVAAEKFEGRIVSLPTRAQINLPIQEQLIVELYSK